MFKIKYRIVQRKDSVLNADFFYIEKQDFPWCSWIPAYAEGYTKRFSTLKSAVNELQTFEEAVYHESV